MLREVQASPAGGGRFTVRGLHPPELSITDRTEEPPCHGSRNAQETQESLAR